MFRSYSAARVDAGSPNPMSTKCDATLQWYFANRVVGCILTAAACRHRLSCTQYWPSEPRRSERKIGVAQAHRT